MYYISSESTFEMMKGFSGTESAVGGNIVIRDSGRKDFVLKTNESYLQRSLRDNGIDPHDVLGVFAYDYDLAVTPISETELKVIEQLRNPRFEMSNNVLSSGSRPYQLYGLYNIRDAISYGDDRYSSVARLLLESCGSVKGGDRQDKRVETSVGQIRLCVASTEHQSVYLLFDIEDYTRVTRMYAKFKVLNLGKNLSATHIFANHEREGSGNI